MADEKLVRFNLMIAPEQLKEIDRYRKDIESLPSKGEAVRDLIQLGLQTYWDKKEKQGRE